jgi:mono/diheme cytochrome c family protein
MSTGNANDTTATRTRRSRTSLAVAVVVAAGSLCAIAPTLLAREGSHAEIERGRYLVAAGDCAACHTDERGQPFAGGRAVPTPFGTIYSTNITSDKSTGIGEWTADDFYRAMHEGIAPGGRHLYPAFPYPWYTKLTRADVDAIRSYLATLSPVRQQNKPSELPWPFDVREVMAGWNALYFDEGTFRSNPQKSAEWNLGAYLVQGLGHCGACHTPKNFAGAVKRDKAFQGGYGENWYATSLGGDLHDGLGQWSTGDIVEYLKTGTNKRAAAFGPMAEVVHDSTQLLDDKDLHAIAVYLKDLPPHEAPGGAATASAGSVKVDADRFARGHGLYVDDCAGCHMDNGEGIAGAFPPLKGNNVVQASDAETLVHVILSGQKTAVTKEKPTGLAMPAFDWKLSDAEVADLATYVRNAWGNRADAIDAGKVADTRKTIVAARTR